MAIVGRIVQGLAGLRARLPADRNAILAGAALTPQQQTAFLSLAIYDQRHLCAVYRYLRDTGVSDRDLLQAGLLHDLGKAALGGRVTLVDRTLNVMLGAFALPLRYRLARLPAPRWRLGLALALHHPQLGAEWASRLGCSERTCWLIAHHADKAAPDDSDLQRLIAADHAC